MTINRSLVLLVALSAALSGGSQRLAAQSIAQRVASAPDGKVRMTFAARPDICGHGTFITHGRNNRTTWNDNEWNADVEYSEYCDESPVRLVLSVSDRRVTKIRTYVGGRWRAPTGTVTDLGTVPVRAATDYLMAIAQSDAGKTSHEAIFPLTLADSVVVWPGLVRLAKNSSLSGETRKQAVFWLSQIAGEEVTSNLANIVREDTIDREIRKQAVFALSQRRGEAVDALIRIARTNRDPEVRKTAMFWLGQTNDPRAIALFEEILKK
ncbi:MAG TPA: HEAT repeat domain-containing protein [Gemmatimonadaceae bacterium]|jgi:hypothetical protein